MADYASTLKLPECTKPLETHLREEIKVATLQRDFALAKAKAAEEYAKKLGTLNGRFSRFHTAEDYENAPMWDVWERTLNASQRLAAQIHDKSAGAQQLIHDQMDPLIEAKKQVVSSFVASRSTVEASLKKAGEELKRQEKEYKTAVTGMDKSIDRFGLARPRGRCKPTKSQAKLLRKAVQKRCDATDYAQTKHNDYVLALAKFREHQDFAYKNTLPKLLDGVEEVQRHHMRDFQACMLQFSEAADHTAQPYTNIQKDLVATLNTLDGAREYETFLERFNDPYFTDPPPLPVFEPLNTVEATEPDTLQENPLFSPSVAYYADIQPNLEEKLRALTDSKTQINVDLEEKKADLNVARREFIKRGVIDDRAPVVTTEQLDQRRYQVEIKREVNALEVANFGLEAELSACKIRERMIAEQKAGDQPPVYHDEQFFSDLVKGRPNPRRYEVVGGG